MKKFISVKLAEDQRSIAINVETISYFYPTERSNTKVCFTNGNEVVVSDAYVDFARRFEALELK